MANVRALNCRVRWRQACVCLGLTILIVGLSAGQLYAQAAPPAGGMLVWFKADVGVEKTGGGAAVVGDIVGDWTDQSSNATNAIAQPAAPILETNANLGGQPVLRWNGTGTDNMGFTVPGPSLAAGQASTYVVVYDSSNLNASANRRLIDFAGPGFRNFSNGETAPEHNSAFDGVIAYEGSITVNDAPHVSVMRHQTNNLEHFVDGVLDTLTAFYNPTSAPVGNWDLKEVNNLAIGTQASSGRAFSGDIAEVLIYDRALSDTEVAEVTSYALQKYSIPEPTSLVLLLGMGSLLLVRCARRRQRH